MPDKVTCPDCGSTAVRVRRRILEKILFAEVFRCRNCTRRVRCVRPLLARPFGSRPPQKSPPGE
jgi:hypothetical protein